MVMGRSHCTIGGLKILLKWRQMEKYYYSVIFMNGVYRYIKSSASIYFYTPALTFIFIYYPFFPSMKIKGGINLDDAD